MTIADNIRKLLADGPQTFYWLAQRYPVHFHADGSHAPTVATLRVSVCTMRSRGEIVLTKAPGGGEYRLP